MKELFEQKRLAAEKALAESGGASTGPSAEDKEARKARLIAQRDALRKAKEEKRQNELQEFKAKTETKDDLFAELKKMDESIKNKKPQNPATDAEQAKRLEIMRKARASIKEDDKAEKEANYQRRVDQLDGKIKPVNRDVAYNIGSDSD